LTRDRFLLAAALLLLAGLLLSLLSVHVDENDGAVYVVIARHLAQDRAPFHLRYLTETLPVFHEHPPLWLWVQAAALTAWPGLHLGLVGALCALGTAAATFSIGRTLLGARAAFLGTLLLVTNESFFRWSPTAKLDPPLVLLFTLTVAVLLRAGTSAGWLALGGLLAGVGALVKGAPALGAPVAAALVLFCSGRRAALRSLRAWLLVAGCALAPLALFAAADRAATGGAWLHGYLHDQLLPSLSGRRSDGRGHLQLLADLLGRGLPIVALAPLALVRERRGRLGLLLWAALVIGAFSAAARSFWWYFLPALPPLALLAGAAADDLLVRLGQERLAERVLPRAAALLGLALLLLLPLRLARHAVRPCRFGSLALRLDALAPPGATLGLVPVDYPNQALLAEHTRRDVVLRDGLAELPPRVALALTVGLPGPARGWRVVAREGRVALVEREARTDLVARPP
jgi:4-amino-4-deoxy-L-arabinose transferase-like glycosyltransferase